MKPMDRKRIVVLISGNGSNLQALIDAVEQGLISGQIVGGFLTSRRRSVFNGPKVLGSRINALICTIRAAESSRSR